jgi:hypothetical protein
MNLLSQQIHDEMDAAERQEMPMSLARAQLEKALSYQFRRLEEGLIAAIVLRRGTIEDRTWAQYQQTSGWWKDRYPQAMNEAADSRESFARLVAKGYIPPIDVGNLAAIQVRIHRKTVAFWDDLAINRQLRALSSDMRFAFPGCHQLTALAVRTAMGADTGSWPIDARFIYGEIGIWSATLFGPLFEFEREIAVSPFLESGAAGFAYENNVVVRSGSFERTEGTVLPEEAKLIRRIHILIHELLHVVSHKIPGRDPFLFATTFFQEYLDHDVCRFVRTPRAQQEVLATFGRYLSLFTMVLTERNKYVDNPWEPPQVDLARTLMRLVDLGRVVEVTDGQFTSAHEEGEPAWSL